MGKNERRAVLQPWGQAGELHYERVEDHDLEIFYELLGQQKNLHRQRWSASGSPKKALLWSYLSRCIILVRIKCVKWYWQNQIELVRQFQRSKPYHDKYKTLSAWKQKDYAKKNAPVLEKYKSVGSQLKLLYPDGRFSSEMVLDRQRQALYEEREKLYEEYRYLKKEYADLDKASQTIGDYLESLRNEPECKMKKGELE